MSLPEWFCDRREARQELEEIEHHAPPTPEEWHAVCDERDHLRGRLAEATEALRELDPEILAKEREAPGD